MIALTLHLAHPSDGNLKTEIKCELSFNPAWRPVLGQLNEYFSSTQKCLELWDLISGRSSVYSLYSDVICKPSRSQKVLMINQRWDIVPLHYQRLNTSWLDLSKYKHQLPTNLINYSNQSKTFNFEMREASLIIDITGETKT